MHALGATCWNKAEGRAPVKGSPKLSALMKTIGSSVASASIHFPIQ
ncbi:hypothetical protein T4B_9098 [Trichinella pseudospiralis]|uniref:Uncharacterized protein n=1 Tax=Trichinella pseudospiralis TaxID=6337 RepID=A0A0V1GD37_TRIPS|nr:hypothetical protein T4B_9098 [Trichinella pseudospiralis]